MAEFPSKVNTETSSPHSQGSSQTGNRLRGMAGNVTGMVDVSFLRNILGILMTIEILMGMIHWALIASTIYVHAPPYGWVMFVGVTLWIFTIILFLLFLSGYHRRLSFIPWPLTMLLYNGIAAALYLTAFVTNAAQIPTGFFYDGRLAAAAFFGAVVTVAYVISTFVSFLDWREDRGNAATSTVPT